jgi:superfamily II DNA or RNA helicase
MHELTARAQGRRVSLPGYFSFPVLIEQVSINGNMAWARVKRPDGGLEEITIESPELEAALAKANAQGMTFVPGNEVFDSLESARIRLAYHFDEFFAVSLSGVRALPHQLEAVYERLLPQPRIRFVLAHDPGAGKTIMAGLLIKELKLRGAAERILILVPAPLTPQWQDELQEKFDETFEIIDSHSETGQVAGNLWQRKNQVIASMDYAKRDAADSAAGRSVRDAILQCSWDLVIVDEAHKASASQYGDEVKPTKRYRLIEELSRSPHVHHMIFLTATPHQGKEEQFRLFLRLLDPDQFEAIDQEEVGKLLAEDRCPFFMRRTKEDLRDFSGRPLFVKRNAYTEDFELGGAEKELYDDVTHYIQEFLGKTYTGRKRMAVALARSVLQRRLASSLHAITESLRRRYERLSNLLEEAERKPPAEREAFLRATGVLTVDDEMEWEDVFEETRDEAEDLPVAETMEGLRREVAELRRLRARSEALRDQGGAEQKLMALRRCLEKSQFAELRDQNGKLLIFTEHRDTLDYLERNLKEWGYSVVTIHGGHSAMERKERRLRFQSPEVQVCIATDAAGEGINLQFCHLMINYDVPWNPNRLEQRMGRIHRIGQEREVHVFNFVAVNTEEGRVLHILLEKIRQICKDLKTDRIFDVIGTFLRVEGLNAEEVLREAAINPRRVEDFIKNVERLSPERVREFEKATRVALARRQLDLGALHQRNELHRDLRLMPEYVEEFFLAAANKVDLNIERRADNLLRIPSVAQRFRSPTLRAVQRFGAARERYLKATFRKEQRGGKNLDAELLSPGHPLYGAVVELLESKLERTQGATALFRDPRAGRPYFLHVFEVGVRGESADLRSSGGTGETIDAQFVVVAEQLDGTREQVSQDIFHELDALKLEQVDEEEARQEGLAVPLEPVLPERVRQVERWVRETIQHPLVKRARDRRQEDARIRREYLERAFEARELRLKADELDLLAQVDRGEQGAAGRLSQVQDVLQQIEKLKVERIRSLERLAVARPGDVRHLASAVVLPLPEGDAAAGLLRSDPVVEETAMRVAMDFERRRGWEPLDVSKLCDGRGYDIQSFGPADDSGIRPVRRIEVKGRSSPNGDVVLTPNEWRKARRLAADYWLYVVYNARPGAEPLLKSVQDPAHVLEQASTELVVVKGYRIAGEAVIQAATEES